MTRPVPTTDDSPEPLDAVGFDRAALVELLLFSVGLMILIWEIWRLWPEREGLESLLGIGAGLLVVVTLVTAFRRRRPSAAHSGFAAAALARGWWPLVAFSGGGVLILAVLGTFWGEPSLARMRDGWLGDYALGVIGQQLGLQLFVNDRFFKIGAGLSAGPRTWFAVVASALLFGAFHVPNLWLAVATPLAALFWTWHFRRYFNLPALMASQFVLGCAAIVLLGDGPLLQLRVGWGALRAMQGG